jgi:hypothetical protein
MICVRKGGADRNVHFAGSFYSQDEFIKGRESLAVVPAAEFVTWTGTASFPLIPDKISGEVFRQMRKSPVFSLKDGFEFRRVRELESADKHLFNTNLAKPDSNIAVLTGSSFYLWSPDFGDPYAFVMGDAIDEILTKVIRSTSQARSAYSGLKIRSFADLPMNKARIAFRDVTNATNTRTMIPCLIPAGVTAIETAPCLLRLQGDEVDEAYVLGVMSSIPFDWYARRVVELHITMEVLDSLPLPRPAEFDPRRQRVVELAGRLAARDERFAKWAEVVGVPIGSFTTTQEREVAEAEIDAIVAHLFGLRRTQLSHIFSTFHRGWSFQSRLDATLSFFDELGDPT